MEMTTIWYVMVCKYLSNICIAFKCGTIIKYRWEKCYIIPATITYIIILF